MSTTQPPGRASPAPEPEPAGPTPQPELDEPRLRDPGLRQLSLRDARAIAIRAVKEALDDGVTNLAGALAYQFFLSIPAMMLIAVGVFGYVAEPSTVDSMLTRLSGVAPPEALSLLRDTLQRQVQNQSGSVVLIAVGSALALWTATSAMMALIWALNVAYERRETRGFLRTRATALLMFVCAFAAVALSFGLLVLGPYMTHWIGSALGAEGLLSWLWWVAQWPVLVTGLLLVFALIYYLGPNVEHPRWQFITPGSVLAVVLWLAASAGFALYASRFSSYNKSWGVVSAVIVLLVWLWLTSLAVVIGAELNSEAERSRELRQGQPAQGALQAPPKA
jgi:membrane protein